MKDLQQKALQLRESGEVQEFLDLTVRQQKLQDEMLPSPTSPTLKIPLRPSQLGPPVPRGEETRQELSVNPKRKNSIRHNDKAKRKQEEAASNLPQEPPP